MGRGGKPGGQGQRETARGMWPTIDRAVRQGWGSTARLVAVILSLCAPASVAGLVFVDRVQAGIDWIAR